MISSTLKTADGRATGLLAGDIIGFIIADQTILLNRFGIDQGNRMYFGDSANDKIMVPELTSTGFMMVAELLAATHQLGIKLVRDDDVIVFEFIEPEKL